MQKSVTDIAVTVAALASAVIAFFAWQADRTLKLEVIAGSAGLFLLLWFLARRQPTSDKSPAAQKTEVEPTVEKLASGRTVIRGTFSMPCKVRETHEQFFGSTFKNVPQLEVEITDGVIDFKWDARREGFKLTTTGVGSSPGPKNRAYFRYRAEGDLE